jgi:hypothetical protein
MQTNTTWHFKNWGLWGWLETAAKLVAILGGFIALSQSQGGVEIGLNMRLLPTLLLVGMTLGTFVALVYRYHQREISSFGFAILNMLGHSAALLALLRVPEQNTGLLILGGMYVLGEIVKQVFLRKTGYAEAGATVATMVKVSQGVMAFYLLFTVLVLFFA